MRQRCRRSVRMLSSALLFLLLLTACSHDQPSNTSSAFSSVSSSSASVSKSSSSAESSLSAKGGPNQLLFSGFGFDAFEISDRYYVLSYGAETVGNDFIISCFDKNLTRLWDYPADDVNMEDGKPLIYVLANGFVAYRSGSGVDECLISVDESGNPAWNAVFGKPENQCLGLAPNEEGGLYMFFNSHFTPKSVSAGWIDQYGNVTDCMSIFEIDRYDLYFNGYNDITEVAVQETLPGMDGDFYVFGPCERRIGGDSTENLQYIARYDSTLSFQQIFFFENGPSGLIQTDLDNNRIYYLGTRGEGETLQGVFYALKANFSTLTEKNYDEGQPYSTALLAGGYTLVSLSGFDNTKLLEQEVYIYNSSWNLADTFNSGVGWPEFYPTEDGGFLLKGKVLAQGESYDALLQSGSKTKLDTVVTKYSSDFEVEWQERYLAADGKSGYDYFVYIDENRNILTE